MPHQPEAFTFQKCQFGKSKPVLHSFQAGWFHLWILLHYHEASDSVFCFLCAKAIKEKKISPGNADAGFVSNRKYDAKQKQPVAVKKGAAK